MTRAENSNQEWKELDVENPSTFPKPFKKVLIRTKTRYVIDGKSFVYKCAAYRIGEMQFELGSSLELGGDRRVVNAKNVIDWRYDE